MPQPSNHCRLGSSFDRDPLSSGHCAAADGRRMGRHGNRQPFGKLAITLGKSQVTEHRLLELADILDLGRLASPSIGHFPFGMRFGRTFRGQFALNSHDRRPGRPHASRKNLAAPLFLHHPMVAGRFNASRQGRVTRRHQDPIRRRGQHPPISGPHSVLGRARHEGRRLHFRSQHASP